MTNDAQAAPAPTGKDLRNFGFTFGAVALLFGALLMWRGRPSAPWAIGAAFLFFAAGGFAPWVLKPAYGPWMKFAEILGSINTRILLGLFFLVGITPTGLALRLAGKDPMTRSFKRKNISSYWTKPAPHADGVRHFDRQF